MKTIFVDGGAGTKPHYGYLLKETGKTKHVVSKTKITSNQAEYMAVLRALTDYQDSEDPIVIKSDSKIIVNQINHEWAINNEQLRKLAQQVWAMLGEMETKDITFIWVPRKENLAGKMLGS